MDQEIKRNWVEALRSGEYRQTEGYLRTDEGHCCLGVLCDLAEKRGVVQGGHDGNRYGYGRWSESHTLPEEVMEWAGTRGDDNPMVTVYLGAEYGTRSMPLAELNDTFKWDFNQIADAIEEQL